MPDYRRYRVEGGIVFLTAVTYGRRHIFAHPQARELLRQAIEQTQRANPWTMEAIVLMYDHLHMLWQLPPGDDDFSGRMQAMKRAFMWAYLEKGGAEILTTESHRRCRRRGVWQPRFWEHQIRDARDFYYHMDYIHMNPVKHKLAAMAKDWPWSSFQRYVRQGWYESNWCGRVEVPGFGDYLWMD